MQAEKSKKNTKTFPLEIEDDLHKQLKVKAIEEDKTLHSLIIDTLSARVQEEPSSYRVRKTNGKTA
jgi:predicted HicB family RNase H-like nuclease